MLAIHRAAALDSYVPLDAPELFFTGAKQKKLALAGWPVKVAALCSRKLTMLDAIQYSGVSCIHYI
jgi:hypothetical protein